MTKALNGESIKSFQPYGYKKDPNNKNTVIVDRNVSDIVVKIFEMYKSGKTKKQICDYLNDNGVTTPLKYKEETTNYRNPNKRFYIWSSCMISKILRDRIYVGDLVQHKYTKVNYKIKKTVKVDPSQHIIVTDNHEMMPLAVFITYKIRDVFFSDNNCPIAIVIFYFTMIYDIVLGL